MFRPKICLCLTAPTLEENLAIIDKYRNWIDVAELRADYLTNDERLHIRRFPEIAGLPCILTIRRKIDGGRYIEGEGARTILFARGLAFADQDTRKNFAYIDLESDFHVPSLQEAARAFGTRVIRSIHDMEGPIKNIRKKVDELRVTDSEIAKIAFMPRTLSDVTDLFREAKDIPDTDMILAAMGPMGLPSRILSARLHSFLTYTSPRETMPNTGTLGHIDPITLCNTYNYRIIDESSRLFGITGYPLSRTSSPEIHNRGFVNNGINAVYVPIQAEQVEDALRFAEETGIEGLSVTIPHKEAVLPYLDQISEEAGEIGACNTIVRHGEQWFGYNTDAAGIMLALQELLGRKDLRGKRVSIIGAGGAARAVAYAVKQMRGRACVFNRTLAKAAEIAKYYTFKYAPLDSSAKYTLAEYSDLIIQTTSIGMGTKPEEIEKDPIYFYDFAGHEVVYDIIYYPEKTALMARAEKAGCKVHNGYSMLEYQAYQQFYLFTGRNYDSNR